MPRPSYTSIMPSPPGWGCWPGRSSRCWWPIGIGIPCFRLKSHFFALATIAIGEVLRYLASYWRGLTQGGVGLLIPFKPGIENFMFKSKLPYAYIALALMLVMLFILLWDPQIPALGFT